MKKISIFITALALTALTLVTSCQKDSPEYRILTGEKVRFSVGSAGAGTKAAYSDDGTSTIERIDWEKGDMIRICCDAVSEPECKWADYVVTKNGTINDDNHAISETDIEGIGGIGLRWGTEGHTFYAVYPSPEDAGSVTTGIYPYEPVELKSSVSKSISGPTVKAKLPASQDVIELKNSGVSNTATPDLNNMLMTAKSREYDPMEGIGDGEVFLAFTPLTTAVQFTITNQTGAGIKVKSVSLISGNGKETAPAINGAFSVDIDATSTPDPIDLDGDGDKDDIVYSRQYPTCTRDVSMETTSNMNLRTNTITFEEPVALSYNATASAAGNLTFTFFLVPTCHFDDLTFKIVLTDDDGENARWMSTRLGYTDGSGILFPCFMKTTVKGLFVPEGAQWTVKYGPDVEPWNQSDNEIKPSPEVSGKNIQLVTPWDNGADNIPLVVDKYNYSLTTVEAGAFSHTGGEGNMTVNSSRSIPGSTSSATPWHIEYMDGGEWKKAATGEKAGGFVTFATVSGGVSAEPADETVQITVDASEAKSVSHNDRLQSAPEKGTETAPYDLSMYDIYGAARTAPVTANSYVIDAPGWYAFPLVYGNAIDTRKAASFNVMAYNPGGSDDDTDNFLSRFKNSKGNGITSPYIELDLGAASLDGWTAYPLWQDVDDAIVTDNSGNFKIIGKSQAEARGLKLGGKCGYVLFHANKANLTQGNVLIAVHDGTNIVWSWHIWVTDEDLSTIAVTNHEGQTLDMLPVNLGWVDANAGGTQTFTEPRSLKCRVVQEVSDYAVEFTVEQTAFNPQSTSGTSLYYQWGRKDPFRSESAGGDIITRSETTTLSYLIQNPLKYVLEEEGEANLGKWYYEGTGGSASYLNMWFASNKTAGSSVAGYTSRPIKTIYDPCPPGFQVPQGNAFTGFSNSGGNVEGYDNFNVSSTVGDSYYFYTGGWQTGGTIFFPNVKYRTANGGSICTNGAANYWTAYPSQTNKGNSFSLCYTSTFLSPQHSVADRGSASSVRPVAE